MSKRKLLSKIAENKFNIGVVLISQSLALTNLFRAMLGRNIAQMSETMIHYEYQKIK